MNKIYFFFGCLSICFLALGSYVLADTDNKPMVAIDPGHGGSDEGSRSGSEVEKTWNLKVALALQKAFEAAGYQVFMTRDSDVPIDSEKRMNMINSSNAKLVIVIHADREWTGTQTGPFLVVEPPNQSQDAAPDTIQPLGAITPSQFHASLRLAQDIGRKLGIDTSLSDLSDSRGVVGEMVSPQGKIACLPHQDLRYLEKPAVVLTPLFLTSTSDLERWSRPGFLEDFSQKVVQGANAFLQVGLSPVGATK